MAVSKDTTAAVVDEREVPGFSYHQLPWGDLIYGTKEELQSLGIGQGKLFPGEPGAPKRQFTVQDPRGFKVRVERRFYTSRFCASIPFPGRERPGSVWAAYAPGVMKSTSYAYHDEYVGSAGALVAVGLVRMEHLPGRPGMRKVVVSIYPDGTVISTQNNSERIRNCAGGKVIRRTGKETFSVCVNVSKEESDLRWEISCRADLEYKARMRALPRPAPLIDPKMTLSDHAALARRTKIRLVWSRPSTE